MAPSVSAEPGEGHAKENRRSAHRDRPHRGRLLERGVDDGAQCRGTERGGTERGGTQRGGTERRCPDIGKLARLGYAPQVPLDMGLPPTVDWYWANESLAPKA